MESAIVESNPFLYPMSLPRGRNAGRSFSLMGRRHYDPTVGRFLEPDSAQWLDPKRFGGINPYAYCLNDPIAYADHTGHMPDWGYWAIGLGIIALLALATVATAGIGGVGIGAAFSAGFTGTAIGAGASGAAITIASSAFAGSVIGAGIGTASGALIGGLSTRSWYGALSGAGRGFVWGAASGALSGGIKGAINYVTSTPLFRSVNAAELNDVKAYGFRCNGHAEGKYFWGTKEGASAFAASEGQTITIGVRVSKQFLNPTVYAWSNLDCFGPAYFFSDIDYLLSVLKGVWFF